MVCCTVQPVKRLLTANLSSLSYYFPTATGRRPFESHLTYIHPLGEINAGKDNKVRASDWGKVERFLTKMQLHSTSQDSPTYTRHR